MVHFEIDNDRKALVITDDERVGGYKYYFQINPTGASITTAAKKIIWESVKTAFDKIPEEIRVSVMWTYVEAATAKIVEYIVSTMPVAYDTSDTDSVEVLSTLGMTIDRSGSNANVINEYLEGVSKSF